MEDDDLEEYKTKKKKSKFDLSKYLYYGCILVVIAIFLFGTFYIIPAGERGVLLTFGKPNMNAIDEGLHLKIPLVQKVVKMDVKTQKSEVDLTAASKDLQDVSTRVAVNYHLVPEQTPEIYQKVGLGYAEKVIAPLEQEINKEVTAKYTAEELITRREEVRQQMKDNLYVKLLERGIIVEEVSIINFAFSPSFALAIEAKVTALQKKLQAENDLERIKIEKEQKITQAEAEAMALRLQKEQITPDLLKLRQIEVQRLAIEKWNGILPQVTGNAIPFISLGNNNQTI